MTEKAFKEWVKRESCAGMDLFSEYEEAWQAALEWAKQGQEPVGWQFYDSENKKWFNGMETNNHRKNTEEAGYIVRDLYAHPAPAQPVRLSEDEVKTIFLENGFTIKEGQADLKPYVYEAAHSLMDAMLAKGARQTETGIPVSTAMQFEDNNGAMRNRPEDCQRFGANGVPSAIWLGKKRYVPESEQPAVVQQDKLDAQRYRWLRNAHEWPAVVDHHQSCKTLWGQELDAEIDAALKATKEE